MDLLAIGDSSIDLYMKVADEGVSEQNEKICFLHGSKILVDHFETSIAGNAVNVAVGCVNLGLKTAVYTELGDDQDGERITEELKGFNINTEYCVRNKGAKTNVHAIVVHGGDRTIFSHHGKFEYKLLKWPKPKWIYYTSLGYGFEDFQQKLVDYLKNNSEIGVAFNPGTIQMSAGVEKVRNFLEITHMLLVNKEEAIKLVGEASLEELHKKLQQLGPKLTVITNGKKGASGFDGKTLIREPIYTTNEPVLDKTGAGDAFSSGFLSAIYHKKSLKEALRWGAINSGSVINEIGAINGLANLAEIKTI